jgi:deoxyinosine 3'endonuclease (endonuclease V)
VREWIFVAVVCPTSIERLGGPRGMRPGSVARRLVSMAAALDQAPYAAVDVHYPPEGGARAAVVTAWEPRFARIAEERVRRLAAAAPYQPGLFYARELPALEAVLARSQSR